MKQKLLAAAILCCMNVSANASGITIEVRWTFTENRIWPRSAVYSASLTERFYLESGGHKVTEEFLHETHEHNGSYKSAGASTLGSTVQGHNFTGHSNITHTFIRNGSIISVVSSEAFEKVLTISTDGVSTCTASVIYRLRPGHTTFDTWRLGNGEAVIDSEMRADNVECTISNH